MKSVASWEIMVPCMMRGKPVRTRHHKQWDSFVRKITGGLTILKPARGQWVEPSTNELYEERMIPVQIDCTRKQIEKIADFTISHYDQKAVRYRLISTEAFIKFKEDVANGKR